ncbi:hypothetical protein NDU88_002671 [Pleurodeles waltl]|uniref:Uncharacterized protein n=1 Tax=Pleurodeles waltl TaxID=8319 RepID=A0AAV7UAG1_PLEWA|nr:hypothetical protein NDU88_002671 [Pleurodeles waltl]
MAAGGSIATKESGACSFRLPPGEKRVCPAERVSSVLFTAPPGAKWQPAALLPLRSLGLVVSGFPQVKREFVPQSGLAASFSLHLKVQNGSRRPCCR